MSTPLGVAIVGCGWVAPAHAAAIELTPGARLVAAVDTKLAAAEQVTRQFGGQPSQDMQVVFERGDVQAVVICLPQPLHAAVTRHALAAGKHVLCEKPMAMTTPECQSMIDAAERASRHLGVVFNYRYAPVARVARELIERGEIGDVRSVVARMNLRQSATYPPPAAWRDSRTTTSGGVLTHRVIHVLDFLTLVLGEPRKIAAVLLDDAAGLEHTAAVSFGFDSGCVATLSVTTAAADAGTRIEISGARGSLVIGDASLELNQQPVQLPPDLDVPPPLRPSLQFGTGHVWVMRDFVNAVATDTPPPVSGADGLRMQRVLEQVYAARATRAALAHLR